MIEIIENFIQPSDQDEIERYVFSPEFPYRLYTIHSYRQNFTDTKKPNLQMSHHLYMHEEGTSPHFRVITPIYASLLSIFGDFTMFRAKVNITTPFPPYDTYATQEPHVDLEYDNGTPLPHMVCLYYINTADGPTVFYHDDGEISKINPKKGTAVVFDGSMVHAGSNPMNHPYRAVVNIDFRIGLNQVP